MQLFSSSQSTYHKNESQSFNGKEKNDVIRKHYEAFINKHVFDY